MVKTPDFEFGFSDKHSAIEQIHRATRKIESEFEWKELCEAIFPDITSTC